MRLNPFQPCICIYWLQQLLQGRKSKVLLVFFGADSYLMTCLTRYFGKFIYNIVLWPYSILIYVSFKLQLTFSYNFLHLLTASYSFLHLLTASYILNKSLTSSYISLQLLTSLFFTNLFCWIFIVANTI